MTETVSVPRYAEATVNEISRHFNNSGFYWRKIFTIAYAYAHTKRNMRAVLGVSRSQLIGLTIDPSFVQHKLWLDSALEPDLSTIRRCIAYVKFMGACDKATGFNRHVENKAYRKLMQKFTDQFIKLGDTP